MIRSLLAGAALLAISTASFAQPETSGANQASGPGPGMAAPPAGNYITMAGQSDQFEIRSSQLAQQRSKDTQVRQFADQMIRDHTNSTQMIMAAAQRSGMTPPAAPPEPMAMQQKMIIDMTGVSGRVFDRTYVTDQITAHQQALALHQAYAQGGDDPNLKAAAARIVPVVQMHLKMLQGMAKMASGPTASDSQ